MHAHLRRGAVAAISGATSRRTSAGAGHRLGQPARGAGRPALDPPLPRAQAEGRRPAALTGIDQVWNYQCADCHSTHLRKNYDEATNTYATTWTDIDVNCEACHGPGSNHLAWANKEGDWAPAAASSATNGTPASRWPTASAPSSSEPGLFFADGQQRDEVFNHGAFLGSRMHAKGVTCSDCHDPHTQSCTRLGKTLCSQCLLPTKYDAPAHHHH
ncbi:MAG: hypothetical protein IPK42_05540 [Betaproteobacteria bacterium]|nr:hypothetical protein [Betaproteobacteria bacterium]